MCNILLLKKLFEAKTVKCSNVCDNWWLGVCCTLLNVWNISLKNLIYWFYWWWIKVLPNETKIPIYLWNLGACDYFFKQFRQPDRISQNIKETHLQNCCSCDISLPWVSKYLGSSGSRIPGSFQRAGGDANYFLCII